MKKEVEVLYRLRYSCTSPSRPALFHTSAWGKGNWAGESSRGRGGIIASDIEDEATFGTDRVK